MQISSKSDNIYTLGSSFSQLLHITQVNLYITVDITDLLSMPTIKALKVVIDQWDGAVESICQACPNISELTLRANGEKSFFEFSPAIKNLNS